MRSPGEIESFQVEVRPTAGSLTGAAVAVADLSGPGGATIGGNDVTVFREAYTRIWTPSDQEGWCPYFTDPADGGTGPVFTCGIPATETPDGSWENSVWKCGGAVRPVVTADRCLFPDALVPERDSFYGEDRNAFPMAVPAGENRMAWVDVNVPASAVPGTYSTQVTVTASGQDAVALPVSLVVSGPALPAAGHGPRPRAGRRRQRQSRALQRPCLRQQRRDVPADAPLHPGVAGEPDADPQPGAGLLAVRRGGRAVRHLGAAAGHRGRGTVGRRAAPGPAAGCPGAARGPQPALRRRRLAGVADLRDPHGFADRMRFYCDELYTKPVFEAHCADPYARAVGAGGWRLGEGDLPSVLIGGQAQEDIAHEWGDYSVLDHEKTRIPIINHLHPKGEGSTRGVYDAPGGFLDGRPDRTLWTYNSNGSLGAGLAWTPHQFWNGWPVLGGVDQPAVSELASAITAWMYRTSGHYYYDGFNRLAQAWNDCSTGAACLYTSFGGHGDGTLYYPGTVARIGGTHAIPVESMRLKRYRDGAETYSLLRQLETGCEGDCPGITRAQLGAIIGEPGHRGRALRPGLVDRRAAGGVRRSPGAAAGPAPRRAAPTPAGHCPRCRSATPAWWRATVRVRRCSSSR